MTTMVYDPRIFLTDTEQEARAIILMPEAGLSSEERWERETAWLMPQLDFRDARLVIDYGCGIGRIARELPVPVLGVDISPTMQQMALRYVARSGFGVVYPDMLLSLVDCGLRFDGAVAVWSLQHVLDLGDAVRLLARSMIPGAPLYTVNRDHRCVPVSIGDEFGWVSDGLDLDLALADAGFGLSTRAPMPDYLCAPGAFLSRWIRS